ncbi:hypothetical protein [Novosphingobium kaempferiae]|uniref:hypothetical protein n=1 Tax=Novosphingobium kaempferiae TaxID=2896849 RepID=UPI001E2C3045|nr:hypothetical protein [Novosphingobium kaempferiae]
MSRTILLLTALAFSAAPALAKAPEQPVSADSKAGKKALLDDNVVTVRNVSREEIVYGLSLVDDDGVEIGTVERLAGNEVVVSDGKAEYRIPFTQLYAFAKDGADLYASRTPKARLKPLPLAVSAPPPPPSMDDEDWSKLGPEGGELPDEGDTEAAPAPAPEATAAPVPAPGS